MTKAFLLGAGLGTRLRPMTNTVPKPLVPVFHRPLAAHALDHLAEAGVSEVAINTHHLHEEWLRAFPNSQYRDLTLHFFHEPTLLETGGGIKNIASFIGQDSILVYNGDILTNIDLKALIASHLASPNAATLAVRSDGPARHLAESEGQIIDIHRKLDRADGTHQFTGLYCLNAEVLDLIPAQEKVSIIPAFLALASAGRLGSFLANEGHWLDLGTREAYLETHGIGAPAVASEEVAQVDPSAKVAPSAIIRNSWVGPGCSVGDGAVIEDSILWPGNSVGARSELTRCIVHSRKEISGVHSSADL